MRTHLPSLLAGLAFATTALPPAALLAQQPPPPAGTTRSYAQIHRLRPEMVNEWLTVQRTEVTPALKKGGATSRTVLQTRVGNSYEFVVLAPFPSWGGFDGPSPLERAIGAEGMNRVNASIRKSVASTMSFMSIRQDSLSIPPTGEANVWRMTLRRAHPGKMVEFLALYRAEVLPAMRKAAADGKLRGTTVAVRGVGAMSREVTTVTMYEKFADLDGGDPLIAVLGREAAAALNARLDALAPTTQTVVRRRLPDLSF